MSASRQLFKGMAATALVMLFSLSLSASVSPGFLMGWLTLILVAMVPAQMVVSLLWRCEHPARLAALPQPLRGLAFAALTVVVGALVAWGVFRVIGGGMSPPGPYPIMFVILSVPVSLWLIVPLQGWPLARFVRNPLALGGSLLAASYAITYALFATLFDFGFLAGAPVYQRELDPGGLWMAWNPLVAAVATVDVILILVLLDFWPVAALIARFGVLRQLPVFGLMAGLITALGAALAWWIAVGYAGMDVVAFQATVCVPMIFGLFIVLVMFEGLPLLQVRQPWRGLLLSALAGVLAVPCFLLYHAVAASSFGLALGRATYDMELWISSAMLAVTFPVMVLYANYLQFWPLRAPQAETGRPS